MNYRMLGMVIGIVVGLGLSYILIRAVNKNHQFRTDYDEMQKQIRGEGYKIAFYAVLIYEAALCLVDEGTLPVKPIALHFMAIFIGVVIQAGYSIWNGAYVGQNTRLGRFLLVAVLASAVNLIVGIMMFLEGEMVVDGVLQGGFVNLLCGILFLILGVVALVRKLADRGTEE